MGAVARNGCRAGAGVSRGRSTEGNEPGYTPEDSPTREGLNLAGRTRPSVVLSRSDEADRLSIRAAITVAETEWLLRPQGLPGTAVRGPACTVVWEAGGATLPPTRLDQETAALSILSIIINDLSANAPDRIHQPVIDRDTNQRDPVQVGRQFNHSLVDPTRDLVCV